MQSQNGFDSIWYGLGAVGAAEAGELGEAGRGQRRGAGGERQQARISLPARGRPLRAPYRRP